jgi:hypothetical protein
MDFVLRTSGRFNTTVSRKNHAQKYTHFNPYRYLKSYMPVMKDDPMI